MKKSDHWSGLFLLAIAMAILWSSSRMPYGELHAPGAGFYPLWLGVILAMMAIGLIGQSTWRKGGNTIGNLLEEKIRLGKVIAVILGLVVYGALLDIVGFLLMTFLLMAFLLRFIDPQSWGKAVGWALGGSVGAYLIFQVWFQQRLPKGFLGL